MRLLAVPIGVLGLVACTKAHDTDTGSGTATVTIVEPKDGSTVCGSPLVVDLDVENFVLVDPSTEDLTPGHGHVDMFLNGQAVDMEPSEHMRVPNVADGAYRLLVSLVNSDHTAIEPYAGDYVFITVDASVCDTGN